MESFQSILCPIDLSDNSMRALGGAAQLCKANKAKLSILFVGDPPLPREAMYAADELDRKIAQQREELKEVLPTIEGVEYQHFFRRGEAAEEIVKFADEENCDLIVLTTHGRSGFLRFLMGSVCESVVRNSNCPVMSIRIPKQEADSDLTDTLKSVTI